MPKLDRYGSQPPIELLRQYQDFGGFYDREKLFWKQIKDVTICSACAPPGGGRNPVTPRFIRHFAMFCLPSPSEISLKAIFKVDTHFRYRYLCYSCTCLGSCICTCTCALLSYALMVIPLLQAITKGFFAEFPQPVKDATEAIVNARWGYAFGYFHPQVKSYIWHH